MFIGGIVGWLCIRGRNLAFFGRYGSFGFWDRTFRLYAGRWRSHPQLGSQRADTGSQGLFERPMGKRTALLADIVLSCFLFIIVAVMEAGGGEIGRQFSSFRESLHFLYDHSSRALSVAARRDRGYQQHIGASAFAALLIDQRCQLQAASAADPLPKPALPWWLAAFFYASYNLLLVFSALVGLAEKLDSLKAGRSTSFLQVSFSQA